MLLIVMVLKQMSLRGRVASEQVLQLFVVGQLWVGLGLIGPLGGKSLRCSRCLICLPSLPVLVLQQVLILMSIE